MAWPLALADIYHNKAVRENNMEVHKASGEQTGGHCRVRAMQRIG